MSGYLHRVESKRQPRGALRLPVDTWQGGLFVEADGTVLQVMFSGKHMPQTDLTRDSIGYWRTVGHPLVTP